MKNDCGMMHKNKNMSVFVDVFQIRLKPRALFFINRAIRSEGLGRVEPQKSDFFAGDVKAPVSLLSSIESKTGKPSDKVRFLIGIFGGFMGEIGRAHV